VYRRTRHAFFHFDILSHPSRWPNVAQWPMVRPSSHGDLLIPLFRHVLNASGKADPLQITHAISTMVCAFVGGHTSADEIVPDGTPEPVQRALAFIRRRLDEAGAAPLSLAEIANEACVSPEHLCRIFKASTGSTPAALVRRERVDRAAVLLARSNYSIAEIATQTGFANEFHLSRRFKAERGITPSSYRSQSRSGGGDPREILP
jgi:AraC family transcriptional regulator